MRRIFIIGLIFSLICGSLSAGSLLLMDSFNARGYGLAQADVAVEGDLDSILVNPAGLASLKSISIGAFYLPWFEDMKIFSFASSYPLLFNSKFLGTIGFNISSFSVEPFDNYDGLGNQLPDLEVGDLLFTIGYGYPLFENFDLGLNLKYFNSKLGEENASAMAVDIGALIYLNIFGIQSGKVNNNLNIGLSIQNIGSSEKYIEEKSPLPYKIRTGISYLFYKKGIIDTTLMLELNKTRNQKNKLSSGIEVGLLNLFKLRMGYKLAADSIISFSTGAGIHYNIQGFNLVFDYALIPLLQEFGSQHAVSMKIEFGDISEKLEINNNLIIMKESFQKGDYENTIKKAKEILAVDLSNKEADEYLEKVSIKKESIKCLKLAKENKKESKFEKSLEYWKKYQELEPQDKTAASEISILKNIINDTEQPSILLNDFQEVDLFTVNSKNYTISGEITDNVELKIVKINNEEIKLHIERNKVQINKEVELVGGENSFEIYAEDSKGNKNVKTIKVIYISETENIKVMKEYFQSGDYENTIKKVKEILSINPFNKEADEYLEKVSIEYLKFAKEKKKEFKFEKSLEYWEKYQELKPEDKTAASEISILKNIFNDTERPEISLNDFQEVDIITVNTKNYTISGEITDNVELKTVKINEEEIELDVHLVTYETKQGKIIDRKLNVYKQTEEKIYYQVKKEGKIKKYYISSSKVLKIIKLEKNKVQINKKVKLIEGENSFKIYAEDLKGNKNEKTIKVIYKTK